MTKSIDYLKLGSITSAINFYFVWHVHMIYTYYYLMTNR